MAPRWLALHAAVVLAVAGCVLLGAWQLDRARDQRDQSVRPAGNSQLAPVEVDTLLPSGTPLALDDVGRRVTARGTYDPDAQFVVPGRELDGRTGSLVLAALVIDDRSALIVVRGWRSGPASDPVPAPPAGAVVVSGWLGASEPAPEPQVLPAGEVGSVHLPTLINLVPYALRDGFLAMAAEDPPGATDAGLTSLPAPVRLEGGGLSFQNVVYAIQWWVFGLAAIVLWTSAIRRDDDRLMPVRVPADR